MRLAHQRIKNHQRPKMGCRNRSDTCVVLIMCGLLASKQHGNCIAAGGAPQQESTSTGQVLKIFSRVSSPRPSQFSFQRVYATGIIPASCCRTELTDQSIVGICCSFSRWTPGRRDQSGSVRQSTALTERPHTICMPRCSTHRQAHSLDNQTSALVGWWSRRTHHRVYRCRPTAAAIA